jgi:hypothetical protein
VDGWIKCGGGEGRGGGNHSSCLWGQFGQTLHDSSPRNLSTTKSGNLQQEMEQPFMQDFFSPFVNRSIHFWIP